MRYASAMAIEHVVEDGLCAQCGTCAGVCPTDALRMRWTLAGGWSPHLDETRCNQCGICEEVCPGTGFDYSADAWWRERNAGAPYGDFLGPYLGLWYGWASDPDTRYAGASGGVATALLQGMLEDDLVDAVVGVRMSPSIPLAAEPSIVRTVAGLAEQRGSKYTTVAQGEALRVIRQTPGRYAFVGLPCHIQGLRLAQRRSRVLRERVTVAVGIFCGLTMLPMGTYVCARRCGLSAEDATTLRWVGYRGPDWPGELRLVDRRGVTRTRAFPDYYDAYFAAWITARCRMCADALAETADISLGDTWLERYYGSPGVSDLIARTPAGAALVERLAPGRLELTVAAPGEMVASQSETYEVKRPVLRGRTWLRRAAGRPVPDFPGLDLRPSLGDKIAGVTGAARESAYRALGILRYRRP